MFNREVVKYATDNESLLSLGQCSKRAVDNDCW